MNLKGLKFSFRLLFLTVLMSCFLNLPTAEAQIVTGTLSEMNSKPIPYATIFVKETKEGTITNTEGQFNIHLEKGTYHFVIRSLGYIQLEKEVSISTDTVQLRLSMKPQNFEIKEVKVFPGDEDPAYFIMRKAIANASYFRYKIKHYEADLYIKSNISFTNIPRIIGRSEMEDGKKFKDYFKENTTYVIESHNKITYHFPNSYDQKVLSKKTSLRGFEEPPVLGLMTESFYEERPNQVISPLSSLALKHYNFRYEGFITVGNSDVFKIKVSPKRKSDELVEGYIYIVDKIWCIYYLDLGTEMEFFDYQIKQQYENTGDENWLPVSHHISGNFGVLGVRGMFYYGASVKYDSISVNEMMAIDPRKSIEPSPKVKPPGPKELELKNELTVITSKEELSNRDVRKAARLNRRILKEQYKDSTLVSGQDYDYNIVDQKDSLITDISWDTIRTIPLSQDEIRSYTLTDSLMAMDTLTVDSTKKVEKGTSLFGKILFGHSDFCKDSLVRFGFDGLIAPGNSGWNTVDGYKYHQKLTLRINPDSGKYISITPLLGYAFHRGAIFSTLNIRLDDIIAHGNLLEIEGGIESRDFKPGILGISPSVNSFSAWFFAENYMKLHETAFMRIAGRQDLNKEFSVIASAEYNHFRPLENSTTYRLSDKKKYSPNVPYGFEVNSPEITEQKSFHYILGARYTLTFDKPWLEESPFLFMEDYLFFGITYKQGLKNVFSSVSDFTHLNFDMQYQTNITPSAGIHLKATTGFFPTANQMHFSQYKHFASSEIPLPFRSFAHRFQLLNDYQSSANTPYIHLGTEFKTEYILFRYLSLINKRTWSESLHFNYISKENLANYWEIGYSSNNVFFVGSLGVFAGFHTEQFESIMVKFSISGFD